MDIDLEALARAVKSIVRGEWPEGYTFRQAAERGFDGITAAEGDALDALEARLG